MARPVCERCGELGSMQIDGKLMMVLCNPCKAIWESSTQRPAIHATLDGFLKSFKKMETPEERTRRMELEAFNGRTKGMRKKK